ncbi:MAG: hypothetical protein M1820_007716 [Bogoriella megaspora]|nr:MAG: hypothetical protein M1820_007716 [Bogoriella megaspora]
MVDASTQYSPPQDHSDIIPQGAHALGNTQTITESSTSNPSGTAIKHGGDSNSPLVKRPPPQSPPEPDPRISPDPSTSIALTSQNVTRQPVAPSNQPQPTANKRQRPDAAAMRPMPVQYIDCDVKDLGIVIADMLMELIRTNDVIPLQDRGLTRFHSRAPPGISVHAYLERLIIHATLSAPILLSMVYFIDRLCHLYPAFTITSLTVHRFLIAAGTVGSKGLSDTFWTNNTYARVGGVTVRELALLELELLVRLQWRIVPQPEMLEEYYRSLVERNEVYYIDDPQARRITQQTAQGDEPVAVDDQRTEVNEVEMDERQDSDNDSDVSITDEAS